MENKQLISNVKEWLEIDNQIKALQKKLKLEEKLKKDITESLVDIMKTNDIEVMSTSDGQLSELPEKLNRSLVKNIYWLLYPFISKMTPIL